jgi:multisubunit Na+/H+ antiporter MnhG subunit
MVDFIAVISQWFLLAAFILELAVKAGVNRQHQFGIVEEHDLYDEISQNQRGTALSVAGLVVAGIALLLTNNPEQYVVQIEIFVVAFGLLLTAPFAHELTLTYRIVLTFQEMALEYGLLFLLYAFIRMVSSFVEPASAVGYTVFILVLAFRVLSVKGEIEAHYKFESEGS